VGLVPGDGREPTVSDVLAAYVLSLAEMIVPGARAGGAFAEEVEIAGDAPTMDRLVAFTGRRPLVTVQDGDINTLATARSRPRPDRQGGLRRARSGCACAGP
jgi:hypothetical protein